MYGKKNKVHNTAKDEKEMPYICKLASCFLEIISTSMPAVKSLFNIEDELKCTD